jgi:hypothetical protein
VTDDAEEKYVMGSANIYLQNTTDSTAYLVLSHTSTYNGTTTITGTVPPGGSIGPLSVGWDTTTPADRQHDSSLHLFLLQHAKEWARYERRCKTRPQNAA